MSAITRFKGSEHAINLHTGVDKHYFGRKLALATLCFGITVRKRCFESQRVHTEENGINLPAFAIYRELGYERIPGTIAMEKTFIKQIFAK